MNVTVLVFPWLFPSLFMVHEFEEVVLVGAWRKRNLAYFGTRNRKLTPYGVRLHFVVFLRSS